MYLTIFDLESAEAFADSKIVCRLYFKNFWNWSMICAVQRWYYKSDYKHFLEAAQFRIL